MRIVRVGSRVGCIEGWFEFGDDECIIKLNCSIALLSPVMLSSMSADLVKANTWYHPGLGFLPASIIEGQSCKGHEAIC